MTPDPEVIDLSAWAQDVGLVPVWANWTPMGAGQTNLVWKVTTANRTPVVAKLYRPERATPLFPNDPNAEWLALSAMQGSRLAPLPIARDIGPFGTLTILEFIDSVEQSSVTALARGLSELHRMCVPSGLRPLSLDPNVLERNVLSMLASMDTRTRSKLMACRPNPPVLETVAEPVFLHGDPVPSNVLSVDGDAVFVDWQCPAIGDPVFDIACAVSPSMRLSCGTEPYGEDVIDEFLARYGNGTVTRRFHLWRTYLTWRFASYAAWRVAQDPSRDGNGLEAELVLLERLKQQDK